MFNKIQKRTARKAFDNGKQVYLLPCKMRVNNMWQKPYCIDLSTEFSFDIAVNAYEYYNCNEELGRYCAFYVTE